jgi:hypothetical protein
MRVPKELNEIHRADVRYELADIAEEKCHSRAILPKRAWLDRQDIRGEVLVGFIALEALKDPELSATIWRPLVILETIRDSPAVIKRRKLDDRQFADGASAVPVFKESIVDSGRRLVFRPATKMDCVEAENAGPAVCKGIALFEAPEHEPSVGEEPFPLSSRRR